MAQLLDESITRVSFPITKFEEDSDGNLVVYGTVTDGTVDSDKQIVDPTWSAKALQSWMESGPNLRVMHSPHLLPAGRGLQVELGTDAHQLKALVVEDQAKKLVRNKVLRAYSVGIANPVIKRDPVATGGRIVGGEFAEVSLVDRPANKNCQLVLAKSEDNDVPWTYGDLDALIAQAEEAERVEKASKLAAPDEDDDEDEGIENDAVSDEDDSGDEDEVTKSYRADCQAWLAREPRIQSGDIPTGTAFLAKMAARSAWQKWDAEGEAEGLNGTADGYAIWLAKRDVRPEVGGGADVDKMPAEDFVDPNGRRFPIHSPGDVSDAVSSYGRAKPLIPMKQFRKRLTAIAHRKGSAFVAELPESWGEGGAEKNITTTSPFASGLVPFNLQGQRADDDDEKDDVAEADLTKRGGKRPRCEKCGSKLRKFIPVEKGHPYPGQRYSHGWIPRPGMEGMPRTRALQKPFNVQTHHAGIALMEAQRAHTQGVPHHEIATQLRQAATDLAGKKLTRVDLLPTGVDRNPDRIQRDDVARLHHIANMYHPEALGGEVSKSKRRLLPDDVAPVGHHREPDGDAVEELEEDAGLPTTPDAVPDDVPESVKGKKPFPGAAKPFGKDDDPDDDDDDDSDESGDDDDDSMEKGIGDPYTVKRLHDALCAAYDWQSVTAAYPAMGNLTDALIPGSLGGALAADVRALRKAFGPDLLDEARAAVHKSFADMYPTAHPTPTTVTPGQFQRPYISAGHAPLNASGGRANSVPPGSHVPHPDDFDRGLITEGHQAESPGDRGDNNPTGSVATGSGAAMYASAAKAAALNAMRAMHDHIAAALPDMCPMASSKFELPADMGATSRPVSSTGFAVSPAPGEVSKAAGFTRKQLSKMIRSAVLEATAPYETHIAALQAEIEELGAQPDPAQAPMRGVVRSTAAASEPAPVERVSLVEKAQQAAATEKTDQIAYLTRLANLGNPNVAQREQAEALLNRLIAS